MSENVAHPPIATREEWLAQRLALLQEEKALTREYDRINAKRRRLPMVAVEADYRFYRAGEEASIRDLFGDKRQLIVYHFMFDPAWETGCMGCTGFVNALGDMSDLAERNTAFVLASRAPYEKLAAYAKAKGWKWPWYSMTAPGAATVAEPDFNRDFGVTIDPGGSFNYKPFETTKPTEMPGTSVFFRLDDQVFHCYSTYARGGEALTDTYRLLDITPYGRQEDFEDSPEGWPQRPTYG